MKKFLRRFLIGLLVLFVLSVLAFWVASRFFGESLGRQVVTQINKQLKSELKVGRVDLSLWNSFPNASINLYSATLRDTRKRPLLNADRLAFRFGLLSLLGSKIKVHSILISKGELTLHVDRKGKANYDIWKSAPSDAKEEKNKDESGGATLLLEEALLEDLELAYVDETARQEIRVRVDEANFSGQFNSKQFVLSSTAKMYSHYMDVDSTTYLDNKKIAYDARIFVDMEKGHYEMDDVTLTLENNSFKAFGYVNDNPKSMYYDLYMHNDEGDLASLLQLLPSAYASSIADFNTAGNFKVKALIKGESDKQHTPQIRAEVNLDKGRISSSKLSDPLNDVALALTYDNGQNSRSGLSFFEIKKFKGLFQGEPLEMDLRVEDLDDPYIHFAMNGALSLNLVYGLLALPSITEGSGKLALRDLRLDGRYEDMLRDYRNGRVSASGSLLFQQAALTINNEKMVIEEGALQMTKGDLSISNIKINGAGSDIALNGTATNLLPVLFADSLNSNEAELGFQASLQSQNLDLDRLMAITAITPETVDTTQVSIDSLKEEQILRREHITQFLKGAFDAQIGQFNYNLIDGRDFKGQLVFNNNELNVKGQTIAMNGRFDVDGQVFFEDEPRLHAKLTCNGIDIRTFFEQTENFGQETLQAQHLQGRLNANIAIYAYWDKEGHFMMDRLRVLAGVGIRDGMLRDFDMLKSFSTYVKEKDLMEIRFVNLQNFLEVRNRRLFLPAMFIQSNALNLTVSGEHSFDQDINYAIKVNAGQVLANRLKKHDPKLSPQPARRKGFFNLYYTITGTIDKYEVTSAKKQVKSDFEKSETYKNELKAALEQEFGPLDLMKEPVDWNDESTE